MYNIIIFAETSIDSTNNVPEEALQRIVQLVILIIPLIAITIMIQKRNAALGQIYGYANKIQRGISLDKGLEKAQGGIKKRTAAYGKYGTNRAGAYAGDKYDKFKNSQFATTQLRMNPNKPSRIAGAARRAKESGQRARAWDQAILEANEGRKNQKQFERQGLAHEIASQSDGLQAFGGKNYQNYVAGQQQKALNERVGEITAKWELGNTDAAEIGKAFAAAVKGEKNQENDAIITASIGRLAQMGAYGSNMLGEQLGALSGIDAERKDVIESALNTGATYGSLISKTGDIAKGEVKIDPTTGTGSFSFGSGNGMGGLSAEQVAGQSEQALMRAGNINTISQETAQAITSNPALMAKITSDEARKMIQHRATNNGQVNTSKKPGPQSESGWKIDSYA